MKAIRFSLSELGSASMLTQDVTGPLDTDPDPAQSNDTTVCISGEDCKQVAAD